MANPRKFSEKIALHNQKQAEETAAFEKIMQEVSVATSKVSSLSATSLGTFKGGSLPNVCASKCDGQNEYITIKQPDDMNSLSFQLGSQPNEGNNQFSTTKRTNNKSNSQASPNHNTIRESRVRSVGIGPIRRPADRKIDTSPYNSGNTVYLSPPSDGQNWRRTSSDSAIHQSLVQNQEHHNHHNHHITHSPGAQRRNLNHHGVNQSNNTKTFSIEQSNQNSITDGRPRSSCGLSRLPGINICPSAYDGSMQIPIGNNTGSLPDLTSVHFPSPLHTPIDQEQENSSSPYSSSPVTVSPTTLSPTTVRYLNNFSIVSHSTQSPGESSLYSPTHSQNASQRNYLSVPGSSPYYNKNISNTLDTYQTIGSPSSQQSYCNSVQSNPGVYQQNRHQSPPNSNLHGSHGNLHNQTILSGYRTPQGRPSPGSSPGLIQSLANNTDSNISAPCSPAPPMSIGNNGSHSNYDFGNDAGYYNQSAIQHHFAQFSLDWATLLQSLVESGCTWTAQIQVDNPNQDYNLSQSPNPQQQQSYSQYDDSTYNSLNSMNFNDINSQNNIVNCGNVTNSSNNVNDNPVTSTNEVQNVVTQSHQHQQQQAQQTPQQLNSNSQTPNTPTSIPEIIFTDFSSIGNDFTKDMFPDLGLGSMDLVGFQMLSDPTLITDSRAEESFREDLDET